MNYLKIFLVDSEGDEARVGAKVGLKSRSWKSRVAKFGLFEALSPCAIALLEVKSLFCLLGVIELYERFFWQASILE